MKKIIFLVIVIILVVSGFSISDKKENKGVVSSKNKDARFIQQKRDDKYILQKNVVPVINQEYTLDFEKEIIVDYIRLEENNVETEEIINEVKDEDIINDMESIVLEDNGEEDITSESMEEKNKVIEETENIEANEESILEENDKVKEDEQEETNQVSINYLKNGFYEEDGNTYFYENDVKVTGLKVINGANNYFSPSGKYLGVSKVKVIDVSYYQKDINWDLFANDSDCYGVILRLGYWTTLDKKFERNLNEVKRLNIPYGIYLFSYATSIEGARREADFTNKMIDKYDIKPTLGIYYDLESFKTKSTSSDNISKNGYNYIAKGYVESVSNHVNNLYDVGIYSGRWYAMNRLGKTAKGYVKWVAEYNNTLKYDSYYKMWQYTSKGSVPGIEGNVDISYLY